MCNTIFYGNKKISIIYSGVLSISSDSWAFSLLSRLVIAIYSGCEAGGRFAQHSRRRRRDEISKTQSFGHLHILDYKYKICYVCMKITRKCV